MDMRAQIILWVAALVFAGCHSETGQADAYGTFEVTEVTVSAETGGRILLFDIREGQDVAEGEEIALIDTTLFHLQKGELEASMKSVMTRIPQVNGQNDILRQQIENLEVNISRIEKMLKNDAATQKQYDDLTGQVAVLRKQMAANHTQKASIAAEQTVLASKMATLYEQIRRSHVRSPLKGVILEKYAEAGEITAPGRPLAKLADLSVVRLKVYVSGAQLGKVKTGAPCTVRIDDGEKDYRSFPGTVSHVSDKAEFTPKIIQTREERVTLVYAVTIDVANDGSMKPGMPGEALF
ncbi:MAG TPA: HlyD family efflux transporter periplasmic adaptor subunit [Prolixibacteraceae bacterium]|nr:HlyD family efflux transporter periplasmic adaptor subunit [Prolixibacteraceae bacterium]